MDEVICIYLYYFGGFCIVEVCNIYNKSREKRNCYCDVVNVYCFDGVNKIKFWNLLFINSIVM